MGWSVLPGGTVRLAWRERGGPPWGEPKIASVGTELVNAFATRELAGHCKSRFDSDGVRHFLQVSAGRKASGGRGQGTGSDLIGNDERRAVLRDKSRLARSSEVNDSEGDRTLGACRVGRRDSSDPRHCRPGASRSARKHRAGRWRRPGARLWRKMAAPIQPGTRYSPGGTSRWTDALRGSGSADQTDFGSARR